MKIALVHDVLNQLGGAEKVLENFLEIWPDATLHTVFYDEAKTAGKFSRYQKKISFLDRFPLAHSHPKLFLAALPWAFGKFSFDGYDIVLSDSSAFAKHVRTGKPHICYCHTPTRFLWTEPDYLDKQGYPAILKWMGKAVMPLIRKADFDSARRVDFFIANSRNVQSRIRKYYGRESVVIPPPVDTEFFRPTVGKQDYFFTVSRLEHYKRMDIIMEAFNELGWPLKVAGTGSGLDKLKAMAGPNVEFLGHVSDDDLRKHYSAAKAFVFAADEDAGIAVVEAQACGTPVVAFGSGGSLETVVKGVTGEFFLQQTRQSLVGVLKSFNPATYDSALIRQHALQFDKKIFQDKIRKFVEEKI
jgi:glycosyltransferase involved in cell wall biosynthesis